MNQIEFGHSVSNSNQFEDLNFEFQTRILPPFSSINIFDYESPTVKFTIIQLFQELPL